MAKRMSRQAQARIQQIADHAYAMGAKPPGIDGVKAADMSLNDQLQAVARAVYGTATAPMDGYCCIEETFDTYVIIEISQGGGVETYYRADYAMGEDGAVTLAARDSWVEVEEVWQAKAATAAKAGLLDLGEAGDLHYASIKALADRHLEVKVAYGGHKGGKDSHNEFFSAKTDFDPENFPAPPLLYYHGFDESGKRMGKPAVTGAFVSRRAGSDGHYLTYKLKNTKYADRQWESAQKGQCVVSPGTVGHLIRKSRDGHLDYWPLAEVSAWDYAANRAPANLHSVAAPVLKALYIAEGLTLPTPLETTPPEAGGDPASAGEQDISSDQADERIVAGVAKALLTLREQRKQ